MAEGKPMSRVAPDATCEALDTGFPEATMDVNGWLESLFEQVVYFTVYDVVTLLSVYYVLNFVR